MGSDGFGSLLDFFEGGLGGAIADFKSIALYSSDDIVKASAVYKAHKASYAPPSS